MMSISKKLLTSSFGIIFVACLCACALVSSCAPNEGSSEVDKGQGQSTATASWSIGTECNTCHEAEVKTTSDSSYLCSVHFEQGTSCVSCHSDETKLTQVHEKASDSTKPPGRLKKTTVESTACTSCHQENDLTAKTAELTLLTDSEGTVVNPHDIPDNDDHAALNCSSCHVMHAEKSATEAAPEMCASCHHAEVYECHTCHA